jgi:hypothetical protein
MLELPKGERFNLEESLEATFNGTISIFKMQIAFTPAQLTDLDPYAWRER